MNIFDIKIVDEIELSNPDIYCKGDKYIITRIDYSKIEVGTGWQVGDVIKVEYTEDYDSILKMSWKMRNNRTENTRLQQNLDYFYGNKL